MNFTLDLNFETERKEAFHPTKKLFFQSLQNRCNELLDKVLFVFFRANFHSLLKR
jgi:hypothetical protein